MCYLTTLILEGQYCRGHCDYSGILPLIGWTHLNLVHLEISEMGLTFVSMFDFLSRLNRKLRYFCIRSIHYEVRPIGNLKRIQSQIGRIESKGNFQIDAAGCS